MPRHIDGQRDVHRQSDPFGCIRLCPFGEFPVGLQELEQGAHDTHQCAAGDEARRNQRTTVETSLVQRFVLRTVRDEPCNQAAYDERSVQLHRDEHTQRERKGRNAYRGQHQRQCRTAEVEHPRRLSAGHQRLDDGRHSVGRGATNAPSPTNPYDLFRIIITPATVAAATNVPRNFHVSCLRGVAPSQ